MRLVFPWLQEFVQVTASPEELGRTLEMLSFELSLTDNVKIGSEPEFTVLEFEIKANRPDVLSVLGLAREAATAYSLPLKLPKLLSLSGSGPAAAVNVTLEAPDLCPRYAAAVVDVSIRSSPQWLAARLEAAGVRPINNVVDVTNYVLLELGQPMHAFDLAKLAGKELRIRRARQGERIRTLDGNDRPLETEMLVIADAERPQAVAGVMGGGLSEVSAATKTIVLESAYFAPNSVRRTSKRLGLKTEASSRFERGADIDAPVVGIERACELLVAIEAGKPRGGVIDEYPSPANRRRLTLRRNRIERVLGQAVPDRDVERILTGLGFQVAPAKANSGAQWEVIVPTFRADVAREVDLIEEVGRHHGYDKLPATFPALLNPAPPEDPRIARDRLVRRMLLAAGCSEALTFSFIEAGIAGHFAASSEIVPIGNPLSAQFAVLRPSLLPGLLNAVAHNRNRGRSDVRLFELGAAVTRRGESRRVAFVWTGDGDAGHWSTKRRDVDFFDVKGLVERIGEALEVELTFDGRGLPPYLVPGRGASVSLGEQPTGVVGMLTPAVTAAAGLAANEDVYVAELSLGEAVQSAPLKARALPRYPAIARDISILVDESLPATTVRGTIRSNAPATLESVREFDRYQGKGVPDGQVSLSLRLTFRSPERTLTDSEVDDAMRQILGALKDAHSAIQR